MDKREPKVGQLWKDKEHRWHFFVTKIGSKQEGFVEKLGPDIVTRYEEWIYWDNLELGMTGNASKVWFLNNATFVSG